MEKHAHGDPGMDYKVEAEDSPNDKSKQQKKKRKKKILLYIILIDFFCYCCRFENIGIRHEIKQFTSAEYFEKSGLNRSSKRINEAKDFPVLAAEAYIETNRTASFEKICSYIETRLYAMPIITEFYDQGDIHGLRFLNHIGKQRVREEMINILLNGGCKYGGENHKFTRKQQRKNKRDKKKKKKKKRRKKPRLPQLPVPKHPPPPTKNEYVL